MSGALINLVRMNTLDETSEHDYTAGEMFERHDEIKLEDPDGCPCAIPMPSVFQNIDHRFNYITGNIGSQSKLIRRNLTINIDWIDNTVSRMLERWMHQRAHVLVAPNFGRNTEFSFRPVRMEGTSYLNGGTAYDLTGNHALEFSQAATGTLLLWDESRGHFLKKPVSDVMPLFQTPGGAGIGAPRNVRNMMKPAYPEGSGSATGPGNSGWVKTGADSSQITFTHNAGAFGHPDCPDTLTVSYTDDISSQRSIEVRGLFDPTDPDYGGLDPTGSGDMVFCIWIKGQMPDDAHLYLVGSSLTDIDLSGKRFDGWTPLIVSRYESSWSAVAPQLFINLVSTDGVAGSFEIGPTMCHQSSGYAYNCGAYWVPSDVWVGTNDLDTVSNFQFPDQGSFITSFFVPSWYGDESTKHVLIGLIGSGSLSIKAGYNTLGTEYILVKDSISGGSCSIYTAGTASSIQAGKINTVAFVWNGNKQSVYLNGLHVGDVDMSACKISFASSVTPLRIGYDRDGRRAYPGLILTSRIDEGAMTATEIKNIHYALTDPVALQFAMNQRGRVYQITAIPQTVRSGAGGSQVIGQLKLEQVTFQHWLADPLNVEEVVR